MSAAENVIAFRPTPDELVRVKPGTYSAAYVRHLGVTVFRTVKLRVDFRLLAHPELILSRWYRVADYRGGRVRAPLHGDLVREISAVLDRRVRWDRIPVGDLKNIIVRAEVRDVTEDRKQDPLAEVNRYSVISRLVEREQ